MGAQGPMRPGSFPGGPPGSMYGHPGMNMGSGMQGQQMGSYGGMRPMGMGQYNSQMGPGYMPGPGGQVKNFFLSEHLEQTWILSFCLLSLNFILST